MRETVDQQSETIEELKTKIEEILVRTEEQKTESEKAAKSLADLVRRFFFPDLSFKRIFIILI